MRRALYVDLSSGRSWSERVDDDVCYTYVGGRALGLYLAYRALRDFGDVSPLVISQGLLTPYDVYGGPFASVVFAEHGKVMSVQTPVRGPLGDHDAYVILGRSSESAYVQVLRDRVEISSSPRDSAITISYDCGVPHVDGYLLPPEVERALKLKNVRGVQIAPGELKRPPSNIVLKKYRYCIELSPYVGRGGLLSAKSIAVLCQTIASRGYLRGDRARDALEILDDVRRSCSQTGCARCPSRCLLSVKDLALDAQTLLLLAHLACTRGKDEAARALSDLAERRSCSSSILEVSLTHVLSDRTLSIIGELADRIDVSSAALLLYMMSTGIPEPIDARSFDLIRRYLAGFRRFVLLLDALGLCRLYAIALSKSIDFPLDDLAKVMTVVTGLDYIEDVDKVVSKAMDLEDGLRTKDVTSIMPETLRSRRESREVRIDLPLNRIRYPQVQVALDLDADADRIAEIALACYKGGCRIIEVGTPVLKRHGIYLMVRKIRERIASYCREVCRCEDFIVVADTKAMDAANIEARIAFRAGADVMTVMAIGDKSKIYEALSEAVRSDKAVMIDLMQLDDPLSKAAELASELKDLSDWIVFCVHRGITEQIRGRGIASDIDLIRRVREVCRGFRLAVAGGLKRDVISKIKSANVDIYIVGAAIYMSDDPELEVKRILEELR